MNIATRRGMVATTVALGGGLAFAASLLYAGSVYVTAFAQVVGPWPGIAGGSVAGFDVAIFSVFALHHSLFARTPVKSWIDRHVAPGLERSTYVWVASVLFIATMWAWIPVPGLAWTIPAPWSALFTGTQVAGVLLTGYASAQLGILALAGVRQAQPEGARESAPLRHTGFYGFVRHPIYFAWLLMVWPSPLMTGSRLVFALVTTAYLVAAVPFEERSLRRTFGPAYDDYCRTVRWRMLPGLY